MRELESETVAKIVPALIAAQAAYKPAVKDAMNDHFRSRYVTLDGVLDAVGDALRSQGIAVMQQTYLESASREGDPDGLMLRTRLVHTSGEWVAGFLPVRPVKDDPQGMGSALTYSRRYGLMTLVGIAPEDDDGQAGSAPAKAAPAKRPPPKAAPAAPAVPAEVKDLRDTIVALGKAQGKQFVQVQTMYTEWSGGLLIAEADADQLGAFLTHLGAQAEASEASDG